MIWQLSGLDFGQSASVNGQIIHGRCWKNIGLDCLDGKMDVFNWWMEYDVLPGQIDLFEEEDYE